MYLGTFIKFMDIEDFIRNLLNEKYSSKKNKASLSIDGHNCHINERIMIKRMTYKEQVILAESILEFILENNKEILTRVTIDCPAFRFYLQVANENEVYRDNFIKEGISSFKFNDLDIYSNLSDQLQIQLSSKHIKSARFIGQ